MEIIIDYSGKMTIDTIASLGDKVKAYNFDLAYKKSNAFKVLIELSQNIAYYSDERIANGNQTNVGIGNVKLICENSRYILTAKNKIFNFKTTKIVNYFAELNKLSIENLRSLKSEKLKNANPLLGSPHIGLIYIALLTNKRIDCSITSIDNTFSELTLKAEIF